MRAADTTLPRHPSLERPWEGPGGLVSQVVLDQSERCLKSYEANPALIEEHANIERSTTQGGYGHRQLFELIQNAADELQSEPGGGIQVVLTGEALYCANLGSPITPEGAETILASHLSRKRGTEIGRFGLGFKSVLSVSDRPRFFSRTGSFGWDAAEARGLILGRVPGGGPTPVLRLAHLLDPFEERRLDPVLDELMRWAVTVVKLPLNDGHADRLARDLEDFPARFLIFSGHVGELVLQDRRDPQAVMLREIRVRSAGNRRTLFTGEAGKSEISEWLVFETLHTPTDAARREAGEYHNRERIPLAWAVPTTGQHGPGEFWAFFPTTYETTLRGVLNAPWKTNEDRQNLLQNNRFNEELMQVAARLIVDSLPELSTPEDPARYLTLITARGREARNWADGMLTDLVYGLAAKSPSLPDQVGTLRTPTEVMLHPERLDREWLARWSAYPGRPVDWCHESVEETVRRSRAEIILERAGKGPASVRAWLEALVSDGSSAASAVAISIVAEMVQQQHSSVEQARQARIVRTDTGQMVAAIPDTIFRRAPLDMPSDDILFVDPDLEDDPAIARALSILGIREADTFGRFAAVLKSGFSTYGRKDWEHFWLLTRQVEIDRVVAHLDEQGIASGRLNVVTRAGRLCSLGGVLLPGRVVGSDDDEDAEFVVDEDFHQPDVTLLRALGMSDHPQPRVPDEFWFQNYRQEAIGAYYATLPAKAGRPSAQSIVVDGPPPAGPLGLLSRLSMKARARFLQAVPTTGLVTHWQVYARTRRNEEPKLVQSPLVWMARRHGALPTSQGFLAVELCVGTALEKHRHALPVAEVDVELSEALGLPDRLDKISGGLWTTLLEQAMEDTNAAHIGSFYALAATQLSAPPRIRCSHGDGWTDLRPTEVAVAADRTQFDRLSSCRVPAVLAPDAESAHLLVDSWAMKSFGEALVTEVRATPLGGNAYLEDVFPQLKLMPGRPARDLSLVRCSELEELIRTPGGQQSRSLDIGRDESAVYWRETDDDLSLMRELNKLLSLGLTEERCAQVLRHREATRKSERVVKIRREETLADKVAAMLGPEILKTRLPQGLIDHVEHEEGQVDGRTVAELALSVHGPALLREYRVELEQEGFELPSQLAGGHRARTFVADLGLPAEFAGFRQPAPDPVVTVDGPVELPRLHGYQGRMVERTVEILTETPPQRGMLGLPTAAGKTRVAVEAVIRTLRTLPTDKTTRPVLWIAQTDELCEQAVQTWQFLWRAIGTSRRLTISRLWSGNEADPVTEGFHVVVATDAQLHRDIESDEYEWLRMAQAVIVDEAHTSISPRYTQVLAALGLTPHRTRCPLVGLSATPFRGANLEETDRLAARYGRNRLDHDRDGSEILGENPYLSLQQLGVLARVRHRELPGARLDLTTTEREDLEQRRRLPPSAEERLGLNNQRNRMLIEEIVSLPDDWPVLLFATSVNHARTMAALLARKGVSAAAISGDTEMGVRRHAIERFRNGNVRVLANYGVLSQGFDAPATRAVVVARPTYSPNVYQQMIGRGLRGPKNGGKEECLIVNVADNIAQFGESLAFRRFEYLWTDR